LPSFATFLLGTALLLPPRIHKARQTLSDVLNDNHLTAELHEPLPDANRTEHAVPLTRLRLRPHPKQVSWPELLDPPRSDCGAEERLVILHSFATTRENGLVTRLCIRAYHEEDGEHRIVALRHLVRWRSAEAGLAFAEALRCGSDEERSLAIDGLAGICQQAALTEALRDRIDAIGAKAALVCVGTRKESDYVRLLDEHVDASRRDAILALLSGFLE